MGANERIDSLLAELAPDAQGIELRPQPYLYRLTLYTLVALLVTALVWASVSEIDTLVLARGRLSTPLPNLVVQPLEPGVLKGIRVRVGQVVSQGDVLATLDPTFAIADASRLRSRLETLALRIDRLQNELSGELDGGSTVTATENASGLAQRRLQADLLTERRAAYAARMSQFEETIEGLRARLETNLRDQEALSRHMDSLGDLESMHVALEQKQLGSKANLLQVRAERLEVERDYTMAVNQAEEILREIAATEAERAAFEKNWRQQTLEDLSEALEEQADLKEQLAKAERRSELVTLTAPEDAVVLEIGNKSVGSVVEEAEPLFILVPLEVELEAEVEVDPSDIGEVEVGDLARIKIDAYPFQKHGTVKGRVSNVSADAFTRDNALGKQSYYLARLSLEDTKLQHLPEPTRLLPGMTLTGEIVTGKRTVISFFLYPVIRVLDESLTER